MTITVVIFIFSLFVVAIIVSIYNQEVVNNLAPKQPAIGIEGQTEIPYPWSLYLEILEKMKTPIPPITGSNIEDAIESIPNIDEISFDIQELGGEPPVTLEPCGLTPDRPIKVRCKPEDCNDYSGLSISDMGGYYVPEKCKLCINKNYHDELFCVNSDNPNAGICNKDLSLQELKSILETIRNDINKPSPFQCSLVHEIQHVEDSNGDPSMKACQSEINAEQKTIECYQSLKQKYCNEGHPDSLNICGETWQLSDPLPGYPGYGSYCPNVQYSIDYSQNKFIPFQQCLCNTPTPGLTLKHCAKCYNQIYPNNSNPDIFDIYCHSK